MYLELIILNNNIYRQELRERQSKKRSIDKNIGRSIKRMEKV